jgi:hypothetical protein
MASGDNATNSITAFRKSPVSQRYSMLARSERIVHPGKNSIGPTTYNSITLSPRLSTLIRVVTVSAKHHVSTGAAVQHVIAGSAVNHVDPGVARQPVIEI